MAQVLVIEDDPRIRSTLIHGLTERGHAVSEATTAMTGLAQAVGNRPDIVVLGLSLPDLHGRAMLRMLRSVSNVPVVAATDETEIVRALDAGADDCLVRPFGAAQVDARIRAVLCRETERVGDPAVVVGGLQIDPKSHKATLDGRLLDLTPREFTLLHYLASHAGEIVSKRELLHEVWQLPNGGTDKTVDVHLSWLRRKLGETAQQTRYLHAVRGVGVRLSLLDE